MTHNDSFVKNGQTIRFQRASLGPGAFRRSLDLRSAVQLSVEPEAPKRKRKAATKGRKPKAKRPSKQRQAETDLSASGEVLYEALRDWRLKEARRRRVPAFTILNNAALQGIARARPLDVEELLGVHGIGPKIIEKHGKEILDIVTNHGG